MRITLLQREMIIQFWTTRKEQDKGWERKKKKEVGQWAVLASFIVTDLFKNRGPVIFLQYMASFTVYHSLP